MELSSNDQQSMHIQHLNPHMLHNQHGCIYNLDIHDQIPRNLLCKQWPLDDERSEYRANGFVN